MGVWMYAYIYDERADIECIYLRSRKGKSDRFTIKEACLPNQIQLWLIMWKSAIELDVGGSADAEACPKIMIWKSTIANIKGAHTRANIKEH